MDLVDWHGVEADPAAGTLRLTRAGMRLDFGGVAKGFAALEAARICREAGIDSALLNMGDSSIYALGAKPGGKKWRIGIQNPTAGQEGVERGKMLGVVEVAGQVVESSGTYERFFVQDGKAYHHIMDPATGHPVDNGLVQVTLILPGDTRWADGLSTSVFVLGPARGLELIEGMPEAAAILVFADKRVLLSRRAAGLFTLDAAGYRLVSADELEK
jgi:thiamine biosynthesis lipoprotein